MLLALSLLLSPFIRSGGRPDTDRCPGRPPGPRRQTHHQDLFVHVNPLLPNYEKIREEDGGSQVSSR